MRLQTIVYVTDMDRTMAWYRKVLDTDPATHGSHWSSFRVGRANLALHHTDEVRPDGRVELSLVTSHALEELVDRLDVAQIPIERGIADETFGRSLLLRDPEGMVVQVNEHALDLYVD